MAKHDIVVLNTTSSGFETDLGNNVARIKGDADDLFQVRNESEVSKFAVSSVENSMIVNGDLTLTGNLSSSLSSTASFGRIDVTNLTGDASQMTNVNQIGHVSSSKQLAARISGAFQHGFELIGENRAISGSSTSTGSFTRVFANVYSGDASDMFNVNEVGHFSSSAQLASNISGSFNKGFGFSGTISGSSTSTGSFGKVEFSGKISGNAAAVTIDESGFFSGSAQLASNISGSFNKGFEFDNSISGSATSTGSFGRIDVNSISGDASQTTGLEQVLPSGTISSSAQIASRVSGSFTSGFLVDGTVSGSATSTGSFGKYEFGSSISITDVSGLTGVPSSVGFISSSKQIASQISGSFNKGFEFDNSISGSATSTGSFSRVVANIYNADASNVTGFTLPSGLASGSAGFASQISGSFKGGFEMIEGGVISSSIKTISSSISSSTTEIGMGQGNDGSTSQSMASASFSIGLANFNNLKINDGAVTSISHRTEILNTGILSKNEKYISGSLRGLPRFRQDVLISGSATSTGSYAKLRAESITVKDIVGDVRKPISGSMDHDNYISASFRPVGTDKPIKIPIFGRGHTVNTQQFTASGSMENQKYRTKMGQLFIDNFGRLNMTVQTGSMVTVAGTWTQGPTTPMNVGGGGAAATGTPNAIIQSSPWAVYSGSAIYDGISWFQTSDVTAVHGSVTSNCSIGTVDAALFLRHSGGSTSGTNTGKYGSFPVTPAHTTFQEDWDGVGWTRGPSDAGTYVKRDGTGGKVGSVNSHIVFNGSDYPTATGTAAWNGVTWQDVGPHTPTARDYGGGFGGVYDGVVAGGASPNNTCVDEWNGTTWASATALPTGQSGAGGAGHQNAGIIMGGTPNTEVQEYNGTSWSESTSLPGAMTNHSTGGSAGKAFAITINSTRFWTGGFVTGSITTNTDKGYNPFSQNPTGRYLLTKKLQANASPSYAGTTTTGSSAGYGGGY